jgi:hypothetical protein
MFEISKGGREDMCQKMIFAISVVIFLWVFAAAQTTLNPPAGFPAFPAQSAGISAYVKIDQPVRITEALTKAFYRVIDVSASHILGTVQVSHFAGNVYPHVYIDTDGWFVAFFLATEPTALVIQWLGDTNNPSAAIKTTLETALETVAKVARITLPKPSFYDFRFPEANKMLILLSVLPSEGTKAMYIKIPNEYKLFLSSYFFYACNFYEALFAGEYAATFKLDEATITKVEGRENLRQVVEDLPTSYFEPEILHEIKVSFTQSGDEGSAGIAIVLIYREP